MPPPICGNLSSAARPRAQELPPSSYGMLTTMARLLSQISQVSEDGKAPK